MGGSLIQFLGGFTFDIFIGVNLIGITCWYLWATTRVADWPKRQTICFVSGMLLLFLAYEGPIAAWSHTFFWAHMTEHLVVMMAAAPLIVLGAPASLTFLASNDATRRRWVVPVLRSRAVRLLTNPGLTWVLFAGALIGTHFTPFYNWALINHDADYFIEQPLFLIAALLFYFPLIGSNLQPRRPTPAHRMLSMGLMMVPEAAVGAVIYFAPTPLYPAFPTARPFGPEPMADQQLAGALMWALVMVVDSFWMMIASADWFASEVRKSRMVDAEIAHELQVERDAAAEAKSGSPPLLLP